MRTESRSALVAETNLFDYFHPKVEVAAERQRAPVSEGTVFYLSSLLVEQSHAAAEGETLAELRQAAASAPLAEAVGLWRRLGDRSLVLLGWFRESLSRRRISPAYCAEMGTGAYGRLRRLFSLASAESPDVYDELADRYDACAEVLREVRDDTRAEDPGAIVALYEEWLRTGSTRVAERLRALGVVPMRARGNA
jgi:hypothetical protein